MLIFIITIQSGKSFVSDIYAFTIGLTVQTTLSRVKTTKTTALPSAKLECTNTILTKIMVLSCTQQILDQKDQTNLKTKTRTP